ncbi:unnamed protein product, partial [Lampetra fluviatilis]
YLGPLSTFAQHDTTVAALLSALGGLRGDASSLPPYAAAVLIELLAHSNGSHSVELWYRNSSLSAPLPISLPGCPQRCPLGDFSRLLLPIVPGDWWDECRDAAGSSLPPGPGGNVTAGLLLSLLVTVTTLLLLLFLAMIWRQRRNNSDAAYSQLMLGES